MTEEHDLDERFYGTTDPVPERGPGFLIDWGAASGLEAATLFEELADWVHWLAHTYTMDARYVPDCWPRHDAMLWELSTLHTQWLGVYRNPTRVMGDPGGQNWQQAQVAARLRLADATARSGCRPGQHRPSPLDR